MTFLGRVSATFFCLRAAHRSRSQLQSPQSTFMSRCEGGVGAIAAASETTPNEAPNEAVDAAVRRPRKGEFLDLKVESLAFGAGAVSRTDSGYVVLVNGGALPGDVVRAEISKRQKRYAEAWLREVLEPSPHRIETRCAHFAEGCGGCKIQHLEYDQQLAEKHRQVQDLFHRQGGFTDIQVSPIIGCAPENRFHYRNKMEFTFSNRQWIPSGPAGEPLGGPVPVGAANTCVLGLHVPARFDKILPIRDCFLQVPEANAILRHVAERVVELGLEPYDIVEHTGFLRNLMIRRGVGPNGELSLMVNIVTSREEPERLQQLAEELVAQHPSITTIVNNITGTKSGSTAGQSQVVLYGVQPLISVTLRGVAFNVSANSFFQPNTAQADVLYEQVERASALTNNEVVYDLYCGTGSIGLSLAHAAKEVYGFELVESAVNDANANAARNGISNAQFFQGDLASMLRDSTDLARSLPQPDVLVLDPPRAGLAPKLIADIARLAPSRIVYVSCNPSTQVRDVTLLVERGYELLTVQPVDMFPHTAHVENVCALVKR